MRGIRFVPVLIAVLGGCASEEPDTQVPEPPEITSPTHGTVLTVTTVRVEGGAESGTWVDVYVDGTRVPVGARVVSGGFVVDEVNLGGEGAHAVTATATDDAGNWSGHSPPVVVYVDTGAPSAAIWTPIDGDVRKSSVVDVVGVAEGAATATLEVDGSVYRDQPVEAGIFQFVGVDLGGEGDHTLRARATDDSGNQGAWGAIVRVRVDTTVPPAPEIAWPENGSYLTDGRVNVRGWAPSGTDVQAYVDDALTSLTASAVGDSFVILQVPLGGDGIKRLTVVAVDSAGNRSSTSPAVVVRVDTSDPLPPVILYPAHGTLLSAATVDVGGIADDGGLVTLWVNSDEVGEAVSLGWEFAFTSVPLHEGPNHLIASVTDLGDRQSELSDTVLVNTDTVAPPLQVEFPPEGHMCASESVDVWGTTEAGASLWVNGWSVEAAMDGSFATRAGLTPGPNTIVVTAADSASNETSVRIAVESYPSEPMLELFWPPDSLLTDSTTVTVTGQASPWATVTVGGAAVPLDPITGYFSCRLTLAHGTNLIRAVAQPPVGSVERTVERVVVSDRIPSVPIPVEPASGQQVPHGRPRLAVTNSSDQDGDTLLYSFFVYYDISLTQEARREEGVSAGPAATTDWTVAPPLSLDGRTYWWRCRVSDGFAHVWSEARSFTVPDVGSNTPHRHLGFGDSITNGAQWYNGDWVQGEAYEPELELALLAFFGAADVVRRYIPGAMVRQVVDSLSMVLEQEVPAYCLLHVGVLDATWYSGGIPQDTLARLKEGYRAMVIGCRQNLTLPVLSTITPLDPGTYSDTFQNVDSLNTRIREVAQEEDAILADHNAAFFGFLNDHPEKTLTDLLSGDGRHLSDLGYSIMAAAWFRAITGHEPGDAGAPGKGVAIARRTRAAR